MLSVQTRYGSIPVLGTPESYPDGSLASCVPAGRVELRTPLGRLVPQHSTDDLRRKEVQPVCFFSNGNLRTLPLETASVVETPAGPVSVELLTFHRQGGLKRAFPLNGRLSGYWSQEDERGLAGGMNLNLPWGCGEIVPLSICFNPSGGWRSLTLWPGEELRVPTRLGPIKARNGISFWEGGQVRSLEPARPLSVPTPIGEFLAFDPDAVGICGDENSLRLDESGQVVGLRTVQTTVNVTFADGTNAEFAPGKRESLCGNSDREPVPMDLEFRDRDVIIRRSLEDPGVRIPYAGSVFRVRQAAPTLERLTIPLGCSV